jgi:hypothetical protein
VDRSRSTFIGISSEDNQLIDADDNYDNKNSTFISDKMLSPYYLAFKFLSSHSTNL